MELNVYTVHDSKTQAFLQPWYARSRGEAIRSFNEAVNDPKSMFYKYPGDFELFEIGVWDDQNGTLTTYETKSSIGLAKQFKRVEDLPHKPMRSSPELADAIQ